MLNKHDLVLLLTDLQSQGEDIGNNIAKLYASKEIPLDVVKFINDRRQFDVANFYELLRHNYNKKKSSLYKNLVSEEQKNPTEYVITLASLNLQILLFAKKLESPELFLSHSRAEEITRVLNNYYKTYDLIPCINLLKLIKADLKAFEGIR